MPEKLTANLAEGPMKVRFGNFEIVNDPDGRPLSLGKGTFGRTYQARHCYLDTIVALKIITERYVADAAVRQRFLIEARAVAKLSHPHIARLYDFGEMDGVLHYAMEYCGGGSLADYVGKRGALSLRQVMEVGQQIAGALKCAHEAGFIHRDLKPSNIMLTAPDGPLFSKLIDFGLVQPSLPGATRSIADDQSADGARFLGTPLFASPEQLREEPMDVRTDLFSLGITLWYLYIGGPPDSGSSAAIAASRLSPESYAARLPANMPAPFRDVLLRLVEKDRAKRFGSAAEVFNAFNLAAVALGFRRAKDYTDPTSQFSEWEEEAAAEGPGTQVAPEPILINHVQDELDSEFRIITRVNEDFTGLNYIAESKADPERVAILHVLHPLLLDDLNIFDRLRVHVAQLAALEDSEIARPLGITAYSDYTCIVLDKPQGTDLLSVLRTERTVHLIEAAPLLETIADAVDKLCNAGLPGVHLAPSRIVVDWEDEPGTGPGHLNKARPKLYPRFLAVSEAPDLARMNEPEDISSTMTTDMLSDPLRADNMPEHFGTLLYRIVAGRNCPIAAALSSQAYVAIPGLSEHSNRLLAQVIAKQHPSTSCGQVLREVLGAEGIIPRVPGHPTAGFTAHRTGSTVAPASATPKTATTTPGATPARTWKAPSVTPAPLQTGGATKPPPTPAVSPPLVIPPLPVTPPSSTLPSAATAPAATPPPIPTVTPPPIPVVATPPPLPVMPKPVEPPVVEPKKSMPVVTEARAKETVAPEPPKPPASPVESKKTTAPAPPIETPKPVASPTDKIAREKLPIVESREQKPAPPPIEVPKPTPPPVEKAKEPPPAVPEVKKKEEPSAVEKFVTAKDLSKEKPTPPSKVTEPPAAKAQDKVAAAPVKEAEKPSVSKDVSKETEALTVKETTPAAKTESKPSETKPPLVPRSLPDAKVGVQPEKAVPPAPPPVPLVPPPVPVSKVADRETEREGVWQNKKFQVAGVGVAVLLVASLSYGAFKMFSHRTTVSPPSVAVTSPVPVPSVAPTPVVSASVTKPPEAPRSVAPGRYAGEVRSTDGTQSFVRELSLESGLSSGYVVESNTDATRKVALTSGRSTGQGNVSARIMFSSNGDRRGDETVTITPGPDNTLQVTFQGRQGTGGNYTLTGTFHPWTADDQNQQEKFLADQNAARAEEARIAAERLASEKSKSQETSNPQVQKENQTKTGENQPRTSSSSSESSRRKQPTGGGQSKSGSSSTASSSHQSAPPPRQQAPPPAPTHSTAPKTQKPSSSSNSNQAPKPFSGTNPGG